MDIILPILGSLVLLEQRLCRSYLSASGLCKRYLGLGTACSDLGLGTFEFSGLLLRNSI